LHIAMHRSATRQIHRAKPAVGASRGGRGLRTDDAVRVCEARLSVQTKSPRFNRGLSFDFIWLFGHSLYAAIFSV
jgi:hypothetical protein